MKFQGFILGGFIGLIIGCLLAVIGGFYDSFAGFALGGYLTGGLGIALLVSPVPTNDEEAKKRIDDIEDEELNKAIQTIMENKDAFTDEEIFEILNKGEFFVALKCINNDKKADVNYIWILKDEISQIIQINPYGITDQIPVISAKEISDVEQVYHPAKTICTDTTAGGKSMCGFHTKKACIAEKTSGSGYYGLYVSFLSPQTPDAKILEIYLCDNLKKNLKKINTDQLREHTKESKIVLSKELSKEFKESLDSAWKSQNYSLYNRLLREGYLATQLSQYQCLAIKDWLKNLFK